MSYGSQFHKYTPADSFIMVIFMVDISNPHIYIMCVCVESYRCEGMKGFEGFCAIFSE